MEKNVFRKRLLTPKHASIAICLLLIGGVMYLNAVPWYYYVLIPVLISPAFSPYKMDDEYLTQSNFVAIPIKEIEKLFVKQSGSVVIYYSKPYKEKVYMTTLHPVDTEGFVASLQQANGAMTVLYEK